MIINKSTNLAQYQRKITIYLEHLSQKNRGPHYGSSDIIIAGFSKKTVGQATI
jgi:hypothetical protein